MSAYEKLFKGKKITLMGLGLLGRGVGDAKYLASCGADLIVTDLKIKEQLETSLAELKEFSNIRYTLGEHKLEDFQGRDLIIKAAGVPLDSPFIAEAKKNDIPVRMSADLFMEYSGVVTIGITGTRGKSTTTHMIAAVLKEAGKKVLLGGNVRGVSNLQLLAEAMPEHVAVLELDSWQCQGLGEAKISPHIAVFTTFLPDHLNYYHGDMDAYLEDKAQIFLHQKPDDIFIMSAQVPVFVKKYKDRVVGHKVILNAMCAIEAARAINIDEPHIKRALETFKGLPGRLEFVREVNGVKIYNDTTATTPDATIAAILALAGGSTEKRTILIMGGADKGLDMANLWPEILAHCKDLYFLAGSGIDRIQSQAPHVPIYPSLRDVVNAALKGAVSGDVIVFSPAFASFGMFKNEYDRGDQFTEIIKNYKK